MNREVLNSEPFIEVGDGLGDGIDDMCNFVGDDEFDVLNGREGTLAASWSPMNRPSLILTGPSRN